MLDLQLEPNNPRHPQAMSGCGVVILAAGASTRMGRSKLLLPWGETSVIGHLLDQWRTFGSFQVTVVCGETNAPLQAELDRVALAAANRIYNSTPELGMFSSIQCAAGWKGWQTALSHWIIALGDQPLIRRETLQQLLDFAAAHNDQICQPSRNRHGRHPVVLPGDIFGALKKTSARTLREFLANYQDRVARCEMDDPGLELDLDTPADYEQALVQRYSTTGA